jgi:hypothetical protein
MEALAKVGEYSGSTDGWGWRTDAHALVAVRGLEQPDHAPGYGVRKAGVEKFVREMVVRPPGSRSARLDCLRATVGTVCRACDGARRTPCDGGEDCDRDGCDGEVHACLFCRTSAGGPARVVKIDGALFDAQLLALVLRTCDAETVGVEIVSHGEWGKSVRLVADGWRAAVMEGRFFENSEAVCPEFTAWAE